jgi:predicted alpha-1,2-mannosidase
MQAELADQWIARLHTIDIDDPNTARVNQFYGALYRTSFLPREFSDVDGRYPRFASQPTQPLNTSTSQHLNFSTSPQKFFTDFSMWDTYRAVHPLYNIIAPTLSAQMMQSLVTMAEQGGWMPIFPCWNSYTAAMIGDHCASVIADAYVKGIGIPGANVPNYLTAYRYLRQNAFDSPTPEQYKNGMGRRALQSYLKNGFVPMEDHVPDAFHTDEQTSRTLEYAYDDFCLAQLALDFGTEADYHALLGRSVNWLNVINPQTGWADGRHVGGKFENNTDLTHRKSYITEGATCHYSWYVPHDVPALIEVMGGPQRFEEKLDSMFEQGLYWHGNEPCHQIAYLYNYIDRNDKTRRWVRHILDTEYNDTPGGLSGNDDAGQMSAWYIFSSLGFYPVCPGTPYYQLSGPTFRRATLNLENGQTFTIEASPQPSTKETKVLSHSEIMAGGTIRY